MILKIYIFFKVWFRWVVSYLRGRAPKVVCSTSSGRCRCRAPRESNWPNKPNRASAVPIFDSTPAWHLRFETHQSHLVSHRAALRIKNLLRIRWASPWPPPRFRLSPGELPRYLTIFMWSLETKEPSGWGSYATFDFQYTII